METGQLYDFGPFRLDAQKRLLLRDSQPVVLTPKALETLIVLVENSGRVMEKDELMSKVWPNTVVEEANLAQHISTLRKTLGESPGDHSYIVTLPGRGYRFVAEVRKASEQADELVVEKRTMSRIIMEETASGDGETDLQSQAYEAHLNRPVLPRAQGPRSTKTLTTNGNLEISKHHGGRKRDLQWALMLAGSALALVSVLIGFNAFRTRDWLFGRPGAGSIRSLAVLPLENLSGNPSQEFLADGLTEALITDLAEVHDLRVISRTSAMQYKGVRKSLPEIAQALKVDAVVEGAVVSSEGRVRVTAQLIEARSEQPLWAETYQRDLRDILGLEGEVASDIAREVKITLTRDEKTRLADRRQVVPAAYEYSLQGWHHQNDGLPAQRKMAIEDFNKAIAIDPTYASPYVGLAISYLKLGQWGNMSAGETEDKAKAAALKAEELDPRMGEAHFALAFASMFFDWDWAGAKREFDLGFQLNPGYPQGHQWYATYLMFTGHLEESVAEQRRNLQLDPLSTLLNFGLGEKLYYARRYDEAIEQLQKTLRMAPNHYPSHYFLADVYRHKGSYKEAAAEYEKAWLLYDEKDKAEGFRNAYDTRGFAGAEKWYREYLIRSEGRPEGSPLQLAIAYAGSKENDLAFQALEKAYDERRPNLLYLNLDPDYDPLRSDPRFAALLRRIGLPP